MRLTVGPLPSAVYWRRRVVVLGAGLLFLIVLLYSCTGPDRNTGATPASTSSATGAAPSVGPEPSGPVLTPQSGDPSAAPGDSGGGSDGGPAGGGTATTDAPAAPAAPVADDGTCTDAEILVTPVAQPATARQGTVVDLQLKIKNKSQRTCSRDVGADLQELFIKSGAEKVWSSDTCGTGKGSDVQSFTPGFERLYELGWNGRDTSRCNAGLAAGPYAPAGTYQLFARVGTKLSEPVKLTVTS